MKRKKIRSHSPWYLVFKSLIYCLYRLAYTLILLPYQLYLVFIPRRYRNGRRASKIFLKVLENKKIKRLAGTGLVVMMMLFGVIGNIIAADEISVVEATLIAKPEILVVTETTLNKPLLGPIAQGFHVFHRAIDILAPIGTPIKPIASGIVKEVSFGRLGWGNTVVVKHDNNLVSRYAHLREINVKFDSRIDKDTQIGTVGMTGWSTGPHLHLEIYENGKAINPLTVLPQFKYLMTQAK